MQSGQTERNPCSDSGRTPSGVIEQRTSNQVDGQAAIVPGSTAKAWQIGGGFVLAGGIQGTEANDQVAQGPQVLRAVVGADGASIFTEGDIAHVMDRFDAPMATAKGLQLRCIHLRVRAAAQDQFSLLGDANTFEMVGGADDDSGLGGVWEAALLGGDFKRPDLASFMPSMALVDGDVFRGKKRRWARETGGPVCRRAWVGWP